MANRLTNKQEKKRFWKWLTILGPGLTTGAADDDPSGIATYSQTGAQFGYGQLWTALYMLPFLMAVQEACARIGLVTGKGIAAIVKEHYSKPVLYAVVSLVVIANTINIGADIGAMAAAAQLLVPVPFVILTLLFTVSILLLEIFTTYRLYAKILKWLALALLSYPITVFIIHQDWPVVLKATVIPHMEFSFAFLFIITGVFGTTITPYLFFWEASQEVEEVKGKGLIDRGNPELASKRMRTMRQDNNAGMIISEVTTWCIILVGATVLHQSGVKDVKTAADAAKALEPLVHSFPNAGFLAKLIFSVGIIGLGFLAIPVLSGSAAYAVSEAFDWKASLNIKLKRAHGFYGVITIATLIGLMINFVGIDPVKALVFTAVLNGVAAVPLLFLIIKIATSDKIMGEYKSGWLSKILLWFTFAFMGTAAIAMFFTL
ncbi:NRAMP (natural resistance-associated macrophage protein) metal ion transporters [Mucilaginibacter lappiensis]|uniref:NRAMP (Natural resistance-associated macrophage protein)-like metal ion transporter n=1 Tax=Mucilaginibacter lappiensis TaxID=354630 RepID=A0ABR6PG69_9SPHI|nr:divalent metal cation transporter [Mucilaginibacter lappiensis]MBB6108651.1 NRAMP (natural resistance-associated macrophage protein)-like metal ion transporter [Mucilaginibacter lappiensis]SIQ29299.1 NRAMP (natural resistance-associated macrophage protein) metal ion transporters [Mucilaginibacter lappiensis]